MARLVGIVGKSGTGKSTSLGKSEIYGIEGLAPAETAIINIAKKELPFMGSAKQYLGKISEGGNYAETYDTSVIYEICKYISEKRLDIKNVFIDDFQYVMCDEFMVNIKKGGFEKFNNIAKHVYDTLTILRSFRDDLNIIFSFHSELDEKDNAYKIKTVGKLLDKLVTIEGLFTVLLFTEVSFDPITKGSKYSFITNSVINDLGVLVPAKSPAGMFVEKNAEDKLVNKIYILNDLKIVIDTMTKYYN